MFKGLIFGMSTGYRLNLVPGFGAGLLFRRVILLICVAFTTLMFSCQPIAAALWPPPLQTQATAIIELAITSTPEAGDEYVLGETITIEVTLDQAMDVPDTGLPELTLDFGKDRSGRDIKRTALYREGSDTITLTFEYIVFIGDQDDDGISIPAGDLQLNETTTLTHEGLPDQPAHKVALPVARIDGVEVEGADSASVVQEGDGITVTVGMAPTVPSIPADQKARNPYEDKDDPRIRGGIIVFDSSVGEEPFADHLIAFVFRRGIETRTPSHTVEPPDAEVVGCRTLRIAINGVFPDYQVGHPSEINFRVLHDSESEGSENNNPATGAPTISGSARVGRTLTARTGSIRDADGLTGVEYSYQWLRASDSVDGVANRWWFQLSSGRLWLWLVTCQGTDRMVWLVVPVTCYHRSMRKRRVEGGVPPGTYETRLRLDDGDSAALHLYACLFSKLERRLFGRLRAGGAVTDLKRECLGAYDIPARMFNSVHASLRGKVLSRRESLALERDMLATAIRRAERVLRGLRKRSLKGLLKPEEWVWVHHKQRRLESLRFRLARVEQDIAEGKVRLCFGSGKLFRAQHHLEANGYADHGEWLAEWRRRRDDSFFVLGSRDEAGGCQACVATVSEDGSVTLRLRLPDCLAGEHGKYLVFEGLHFNHGHHQVVAALDSCREYRKYRREHPGEPQGDVPSWLGQAVSYRFKVDAKGWRVFATVDREEVPVVTDSRRGALGVDLNEDHLAVTETDSWGNWVHSFSVPLVTHGKTARQAEALTGDAVAEVVEYAGSVGKPIAYEKLDFRGKKASLEGESPGRARMLSSFAYGRFRAYLVSRGHREGVEVVGVNPAFSSIVGRVKFMERYGLTVHQAAALVLARRIPGCSERIPRRWECPDGRDGHVAFTVPVRKQVKHVWTYWGVISRQLGPALAARRRPGKRRRGPDPAGADLGAYAPGFGPGEDPFGGPG